MTREEVVNSMSLQDAIQVLKDTNCYGTMDIAKTVILKALEQEPKLRQALEQEKGAYNALVKDLQCSDCISRQAVLERAINAPIAKVMTEDKVIYRKIVFADEIENIPPVTAEKVGHWIDHQEDRWIYAKCSECETVHDTRTNYCPNCGAKMEVKN